MESNFGYGGMFKSNRKLELALLAIGFALFIFLGARGLNKISDKAVAAGEAYKSGVQSVIGTPLQETVSGISQGQLMSEQYTAQEAQKAKAHQAKSSNNKDEDVPALHHEVAGAKARADKARNPANTERSGI